MIDNLDLYHASQIRQEFLEKYSQKVVSKKILEVYRLVIKSQSRSKTI